MRFRLRWGAKSFFYCYNPVRLREVNKIAKAKKERFE